MDYHILDTSTLKLDPATMGAFDQNGQLQVLPAEYWQQFSQPEISAFCVRNGLYCIPTTELCAWLQQEIGSQTAIEIGSGNGVLAHALGIQGTDNKMQEWPGIARMYREAEQATIKYGPHVLNREAQDAVRMLKPELVIAAWVTHRYEVREHWRGGNQYGVKEEHLLRKARYCFIGHRKVHENKPILALPHKEHSFPWLVSRGIAPELNFIAIWEKQPG